MRAEVPNEEAAACKMILTMITIVANVHLPAVLRQPLVMSIVAVDMLTKTVDMLQTKTIAAGIHPQPLHHPQEGTTIITIIIITVILDHLEEALAIAIEETPPGNHGEHHPVHQVEEEEDLALPVAAATTRLPTLH